MDKKFPKPVHFDELPIPPGPPFTPEQTQYVVNVLVTEVCLIGRNLNISPEKCVETWRVMGATAKAMGCHLHAAAYSIAANEMEKALIEVEKEAAQTDPAVN